MYQAGTLIKVIEMQYPNAITPKWLVNLELS